MSVCVQVSVGGAQAGAPGARGQWAGSDPVGLSCRRQAGCSSWYVPGAICLPCGEQGDRGREDFRTRVKCWPRGYGVQRWVGDAVGPGLFR